MNLSELLWSPKLLGTIPMSASPFCRFSMLHSVQGIENASKSALTTYSAIASVSVSKVDDLKSRKWGSVCGDLIVGVVWTGCIVGAWDWGVGTDTSADREALFLSERLEIFISWLQTLIEWLMGNPAGLKLNRPLNQTLGHFFLYHIYLWRTYITFLGPVLKNMLVLFRWMGVLGFSFQLALLIDLMGIMTVHVYCFHIYAARLFELHSRALVSLWRLFRGKKKNPLRKRIDSIDFDPQQLLLGCLLFTVLLFLLPTVLVYFIVFAALRLVPLWSAWLLLRVARLPSLIGHANKDKKE